MERERSPLPENPPAMAPTDARAARSARENCVLRACCYHDGAVGWKPARVTLGCIGVYLSQHGHNIVRHKGTYARQPKQVYAFPKMHSRHSFGLTKQNSQLIEVEKISSCSPCSPSWPRVSYTTVLPRPDSRANKHAGRPRMHMFLHTHYAQLFEHVSGKLLDSYV